MGHHGATNALLERKGRRTLLIITKGFPPTAGAFAYQKTGQALGLPSSSARSCSTTRVVEIDERMTARAGIARRRTSPGTWRSPRRHTLAGSARPPRVAHANPTLPDRLLADLAREIGFTQNLGPISSARLIKLV